MKIRHDFCLIRKPFASASLKILYIFSTLYIALNYLGYVARYFKNFKLLIDLLSNVTSFLEFIPIIGKSMLTT